MAEGASYEFENVKAGGRPRLQIIRGLPGYGKSTLARKYPCVHYELDHYCLRGGEYVWTPVRDKKATNWLLKTVRYMQKCGLDVVVSGVLADPLTALGSLIFQSMQLDCEVWIKDLVDREYGSIHDVRQEDMDRFRAAFVPFDTSVYDEKSVRFPKDKNGLRLSIGQTKDFMKFLRYHVHAGLMPCEYVNVPYIGVEVE